MSQKKDNALIVFLKYPETEKVKTRLAKEIGSRRAMEFYREVAGFVADSFSGSRNWTTFFFYTPGERKKEVLKWLGDREGLFFAQQTGSLGQRMSRAFEECFSLGFRNVAIIGTDCVMITEQDVETAFSLLSGGKFEAVLGPATDGGYYLLGLCRNTDAVFKDMQWSTSRVFGETEKRIRESGMRHAVMRELGDIDEEKDIRIKDIMTRDAELARRLEQVLLKDRKISAGGEEEREPE